MWFILRVTLDTLVIVDAALPPAERRIPFFMIQ